MYPDWLLSKALNTDPRYALYVFLSQVVPCYWWLQLHLKCSMHDPVLRLRGVDMHCFCLQCPSLQEAHVHILDDASGDIIPRHTGATLSIAVYAE